LEQNSISVASKYIIQNIEENDKTLNELKKSLLTIESDKMDKANIKNNIDTVLGFISDFVTNFGSLDIGEKKNAIRLIFKEIVYDGENLRVKFF